MDLNQKSNVKFDPALSAIRVGQKAQLHLTLPDEEVLAKTKKVVLR